MATKATERFSADALIERCQAVGWDSKPVSDGLRFATGTGEFLVVREEYPTMAALRQAEKSAVKMGLEAAERGQERAQALLTEMQARPERPADDHSERDARNRAALLRAAGPHYMIEPEDVELAWFTMKHPAPWQRNVWMTVPIAAYLLEHHNVPGRPGMPGTNRPQVESNIEYFRDLIFTGQMHYTHQGLGTDVDARMIDGQHRLAGLIAAAELMESPRFACQFTVGLAKEAFMAVDAGLVKKASQLFAMKGEAHGPTLSQATRLIIAYGTTNARTRMKGRGVSAQILTSFEDSKETMRFAVGRARQAVGVRKDKRPPINAASLAAAYYLLLDTNGSENTYVHAFFDGLVKGYKAQTRQLLDADDPRELLCNELRRLRDRGMRTPTADQMGMIIGAWNNLAIGNHPTTGLRWKVGITDIPRVTLCADSGPNRSTPPRGLAGELD